MNKKYQVLLFDLDGTIADTDEMIVQTMNTLYVLYRNGKRTPREQIYYFSGPPIYETLNKEFPNCDMEFMHSEFRRISKELYPSLVKCYPHARDTLIKLKENGYKLGIVTNKIHSSTLYCLELIGLKDIFESLVCYDDVINHKPHEESILVSLNNFQASDLSKVLYIGDNESDLKCANNAHVDCALVSWGPRKLPKDLKPTFFISSFEELERKLL